MRIFTDGAEMADTSFFSISTATVAGAYYYYMQSTNGYAIRQVPNLSELYFRQRYWVNPYGSLSHIGFRHNTSLQINVTTTSGPVWALYLNGSLVGTSSHYFSNDTWHLLEIYVKLHTSGRITLNINGITEIDYSGDTIGAGSDHIDSLYWQANAADGVLLLDDLALNSTDNSDGKGDISWCGDGYVRKITPSGSGTANDWGNNGGVSGSANYLYVDEYPSDGDTTYIYSSTSGSTQRFAMSNDFDTSGKTIRRVFAEARVKRASATETYVEIGQLTLGGTDTLSGSTLVSTVYQRLTGPEEKVNPVSGSAWTKADIDSLEFVAKIA